jgi:hypothetical protein
MGHARRITPSPAPLPSPGVPGAGVGARPSTEEVITGNSTRSVPNNEPHNSSRHIILCKCSSRTSSRKSSGDPSIRS